MHYILRILICLLLSCICSQAMGFIATGTLSVTATVGGSTHCELGTVKDMLFPHYSALNTQPDKATGAISVNCTQGLPYDIGINQGQGAGATEEQRKVTRLGGQQELNYNLYRDPNHLYKYGTIIGQNTLHQLGIGASQLITIYGEIPINQPAEPGPYYDRVTIIITF